MTRTDPAHGPSRPARGFAGLLLGLSVAQGPAEVQEAEARAALLEAEAFVARGRYERAIDDYERLVERFPGTLAAERAQARAGPNGFLGAVDLSRTGAATNRLAVALLAEGFQLGDQTEFARRAADVAKELEAEPFLREYSRYLSVRRLHIVSAEKGTSGSGLSFSTPLSARTISDASSSVFLSVSVPRVEAVLGQAGHSGGIALAIVAGGGFGSAAAAPRLASADPGSALPLAPGVVALGDLATQDLMANLGHALAGLASERPAATGLRRMPVPGRDADFGALPPNVSRTPYALPWQHWVDAQIGNIGAFEGAEGQLRGSWRACEAGCWMGAQGGDAFCAVCREALVLALYEQVDPIDRCTPTAQPSAAQRASDFALRGDPTIELEVEVLQPRSHRLRVRWWVLPGETVPQGPTLEDRSGPRPRSSRGRLPDLSAEAAAEERPAKGRARFELDTRTLEPGLYRIVCRVEDDTLVRGERHPWVLSDPHGLLTSERGWWVVVD